MNDVSTLDVDLHVFQSTEFFLQRKKKLGKKLGNINDDDGLIAQQFTQYQQKISSTV